LARGYHKNPERTVESFITAPVWAPPGRIYKTGDLVRQNPDGSFNFIGRKDTQVKVHGQRVELGEIEHHLNLQSVVKHGLVVMPQSGPFKGRLVSVSSLSTTTNTGDRCPFKIEDTSSKVSNQITEHLASCLPSYMVPSAVLVVEDIPMLSSGKLDRKQVKTWIENMNDQFYRQTIDIIQPEKQESTQAPSTEVEHILRLVWSHVLNLRLDQIEPTRSFLGLGGDSISAMQVKGQCAKRDISVSVQDILRSKSVKHLAQCAKAVAQLSYDEEVLERSFDLSPIQQLFFKLPGQGRGHFNQSFFLRVTRRIQKKDLRQAIETIVARHSMLRSRFSLSGTDNKWQQRITPDVGPSYRLKAYTVASRDETTTAISTTQVSLDIVNGPVFAADLFDVEGDDQLLFMIAHHLVIDLVSWRVILEDLEEILTNPTAPSIHDPLPFQSWCQMQREHCQKVSINKVLPIQNVPTGNAEYWEMAELANNYGSVASQRFELDSETTSLILTNCHRTLHTEPIDILLSALIHSFAVVFPDRAVPAIYNEGHGRELSGMPTDLSRTVGWFTIMYPVHVPASASKDFVETVRNVKDLRRKTPDNGRPYFASRCLTDEGRQRFGDHWPLEITFNYLGQYQQLEREGALLRPVEEMAGEARGAGGTADVGHETPRFGIFEISAVIAQGRLRFSFTFNKHMKHQDKIMNWVSTCRRTLGEIAKTLTQIEPQATLGDFPLLSLDYDRLQTMTTERLPQIGLSSIEEVEDIYPSSSMQEGLLISQNKSAAFYAVQVIYELKVRDSDHADRQRLADAWQMVVNRHASLRTVFIESVSSDDGLYDQVVLKNLEPNIIQMDCSSDRYALRVLGEKGFANYGDGRHPPHRMTICQTRAGKIFCKLEISHTIMDGGSMSIIFRDLSLAYEGLLRDGSGPLYSDYIAYLQKQPSEASVTYWKTYLADIEPCNFPTLNDGAIEITKQLRSLRLDFSNSQFSELKRFCDENGVTLSNALHTAWGLTLRCYTDCDDICFGYLTSGRDYPVDRIEEAVGPFINLLVCRCSMVPASRLGAVLDQVQKDYMDSLTHRHVSLAEVQHALKLSGTGLFNTALSYRRLPANQSAVKPAAEFVEAVPIYDPTEYSLSVNIEASENHAVIDLDYWTDCIADGQAAHIASTFIQSIQNIVCHSQKLIEQLDHLGDYSRRQILGWNNNMPSTSDECVHSVIQAQTKLQPYAPAVCGWDAEFTYTELDDKSSRLALHLVDLGVGAGDFVPTCFDKSSWAVVAMLAVLKAGGAAVPLDATHPLPALELRVRETQAHVVLASQSRADTFGEMVPSVVPVSKEFLDTLSTTSREIGERVQPTDPSFVIFTSGSTGRPKGVVLEHRAIATSGHATGTAYDFGPHSRVLQFATYTFDNSLAEIFITLMRGGCVCVPSEHDRFNNLAEAINRMDVNFLDITPTVASLLHPSDVPKVKDVSLGGEPLTRDNIEVWGKAVKLHCCYGPSECSINSTHNGDLERSSEATNIGRSIGSLSWIVDPINHDHLTPVGGVGELLIEVRFLLVLDYFL
jgi:non-ribosomal peptide synthase protein (TIGR01720 family)